ncbi:MAG: hypothetical protein U0M45_01615 [Lachnospiraceae bacterium]|nr:hypothetical protein [Lachnospiraceae bacterium]
MLEYAEEKQYKKAMEIADTIDWRRVKNPSMLNTVSEIYEYNGEFQKSRDILFVAYDRAPESRKIIYRLGLLALKINDTDEASDCYEEFVKVAPKDPNQYILKYKILKAQNAPYAEQISALEDFKKAEYVEKWAYELASLYHQAGMTAKCLEECDDLILWFSEGKYVYQAMELKMKYKPLTPLQQEKYDSRPGARPKVNTLAAVKAKAAQAKAAEQVKEENTVKEENIRKEEPQEAVREEQVEEKPEEAVAEEAEEREKPAESEKSSAITKVVAGATLEEALTNLASGIKIEEEAMAQKEEELLLGGQMKIDEILQEWEEKQKVHADAIEEQKKKDEERIRKEREAAEKRREAERLEIERKAAEAEAARKAAEEEAARKAAEEEAARKAAEEEAARKAAEEEAARKAAEEAERKAELEAIVQMAEKDRDPGLEGKTQRLPDDILELVEQLESRVAGTEAAKEMEEELTEEDEMEEEIFGGAEDDFVGGEETELPEIDEEYLQAEFENEAAYDDVEYAEEDDFDEEEYEEIEAEEDFEEADFEEEDFEEDDFDEEEYEEVEDGDDFEEYEEVEDGEDFEEYEDDLDDAYEEDFAEEEYEDDFDNDFSEEDFDEFDEAEDEEDFEADFEEEDFEEEDFEEDEEDFDLDSFFAEEESVKAADFEIEEPSEAEIQKRIKKSKGSGVPFDTGFVVTGRYDLSATSEIGLKAGLTEEQKKLFSYFVPVRGMSEQIVEVLDNDRRAQREGTSKTGNLLVIGRKGSGKTVLAVDIVKAIQKQRNLKQGKVAIVTGESLNKKELSNIIQKLRGGAIIIEKAGKLNARTVKELSYLMEKKTGEMLFVLEDQRKPLERILTANPDFKRKFTSKLELPVFINDELVTFGQTYAKENGYKLDEMGILALYSRIDVMQREDHAVTVAEVKEIMDEAIAHSQKANVKHLARRVFGKSTDDSDRVILKEEDFKI